MQYQRISIRDGDLRVSPRDELGNSLTVSGTGQDDLLTLQAAVVRDLRNDAARPTSGSLIRFGVEQSVPIGLGSILLNRVRGSYSYYIPVKLLRTKGPQTFAFNLQGGSIFGDAPPYEAFNIGGSNSVRGYSEGELGTGKSFLQGTAEYRFPIFNIVGGALFFDAATTLGTQGSVLGRPGEARGKPGQGFGYGIGVRVNTPLGNIRVDYGFNDRGDSAVTFGIGERF
jgi:outer membrane protein insertion porin family